MKNKIAAAVLVATFMVPQAALVWADAVGTTTPAAETPAKAPTKAHKHHKHSKAKTAPATATPAAAPATPAQ